jgi:protein-L-isoaspartate O-methyltransferase
MLLYCSSSLYSNSGSVGCGFVCGDGIGGAAARRGYKSHRIALRKRLGQHLLKNPDVVLNIVRAAAVTPQELVLEIGPGTGNMTVPLLQQARGVFAVELDPAMHTAVTTRVRHL